MSFADLPEVEAVALGGSVASGNIGSDSDIDLYVYANREIPVATRAHLIRERAERAEVDSRFWEPCDEWIEATSSTAVDAVYRKPAWIEDELDRVLLRNEASIGYSTALWHNVRHSAPLFDRGGWFAELQETANNPYPEDLRRAIVDKNHPILRDIISSYLHQIEKAALRADLVSVNHRVGALLASYFDIIFAVNRATHPGEKRLLKLARDCEKTPPLMTEQVHALLGASCSPDRGVLVHAGELLDGLDQLLVEEKLIDR
jgi:predicted nucleotidyltransferase